MIETFLSEHVFAISAAILAVSGIVIASSDVLYLVMGSIGYIALSAKSMLKNARD